MEIYRSVASAAIQDWQPSSMVWFPYVMVTIMWITLVVTDRELTKWGYKDCLDSLGNMKGSFNAMLPKGNLSICSWLMMLDALYSSIRARSSSQLSLQQCLLSLSILCSREESRAPWWPEKEIQFWQTQVCEDQSPSNHFRYQRSYEWYDYVHFSV